MSTSPTTEQPGDVQPSRQARIARANTENTSMTLKVATAHPRRELAEDRNGKHTVWSEEYWARHSSRHLDQKSPCPSRRGKSAESKNERTELTKESAPEENPFLSKPVIAVEETVTVVDSVWKTSQPLLSTYFRSHPDQQSSSSEEEGSSAKPDHEKERTALDANPPLSKRPLILDGRSSTPDLSCSSGRHHNQQSPGQVVRNAEESYRKEEACKGITRDENPFLSKFPFPPTKSKRTNERLEGPKWIGRGENYYSSKHPLPPTQSKSTSNQEIEALQGTAPRENPNLSTLTLRHIEMGEDPAKSVQSWNEIASSSTVASHQDFNPSPTCLPGANIFNEAAEKPALRSSVPSTLPQALIYDVWRHISRPKIVRENVIGKTRAEAGKRLKRYFSHVSIPIKGPVVRAQHKTVKPRPRKRALIANPQKDPVKRQPFKLTQSRQCVATEDDGGRPAAAVHGEEPVSSQSTEPPIPSPNSKVQKIPTKDPAKQYYSHQAHGGWCSIPKMPLLRLRRRRGRRRARRELQRVYCEGVKSTCLRAGRW